MTTKQTEAAGRRAIAKFNRAKIAEQKEIAALKTVSIHTLMKRHGVVRLFNGSRTYNKLVNTIVARDKRLKVLAGKI